MFKTPKKWLCKGLKKQKKLDLTRCENSRKTKKYAHEEKFQNRYNWISVS